MLLRGSACQTHGSLGAEAGDGASTRCWTLLLLVVRVETRQHQHGDADVHRARLEPEMGVGLEVRHVRSLGRNGGVVERTFSLNRHRGGRARRGWVCVPNACPPPPPPLAACRRPDRHGLGVGWGRVRVRQPPNPNPQIRIPLSNLHTKTFVSRRQHLWNNRGAWVPSARVKIAGLSKFIAPPTSPNSLRHLDVLVLTPALFCVAKQETSIHGQFVDSAQHTEHHGRVSSYHFEMGHAPAQLELGGTKRLPTESACLPHRLLHTSSHRPSQKHGRSPILLLLVGSGQQARGEIEIRSSVLLLP